jgi:membrane protein YdbS with pleckstrin-like domain
MMAAVAYVAKNLMPGEEVVLKPRYHWVRFVRAGMAILLGLVLAALALAGVPESASEAGFGLRNGLLIASGIAVLFGLLAIGRRWFVDSFDEFAVTSFRVIRKTGILERTVRQFPLDRVQDVTVHSTLGGRWLSYGDVEIQTAGSDSTVVFPRILHPENLRNVLFTSRARGGGDGLGGIASSAPVAGARPSVEARLQELERLRKSGLITDAEYQEKRKALVAEL